MFQYTPIHILAYMYIGAAYGAVGIDDISIFPKV